MLRKTKAYIGKSPHQLFVLVCVSEIVAAVYQIIIVTLPHMSIGTGVIAAVTFQQVDSTPHAETGTQSHNQSLKNFDSRVKEFHSRFSFMETFFGRLKNEMFYGFEKDYPSFQAFSKVIAEYIDYYNNSRIQAKTKWMPPLYRKSRN